MEADFSGYATKAGLVCSDGRTIMPDAFKHQDKITVPLVWQHGHNSPENVLGHAVLEHRPDGVYTYAYFNDSAPAQQAKQAVMHGDIKMLSIWANQLIERSKRVLHGMIREVSLVLSGANPGAVIDNVNIRHSDGDMTQLDDEAIITTGLELEIHHADNTDKGAKTMPTEDPTVQEIYDTFSTEQKDVVAAIVATAVEDANNALAQSAIDTTEIKNELKEIKEGLTMSHSIFDQTTGSDAYTISHDDMKAVIADAKTRGSFKEAINQYAIVHNITNIDILFPDAKNITGMPEFNKRRTEWVTNFLNGTSKTPFNRIKTLSADITWDNARAKGYVKGNLKKEEFIAIGKRITTPTTVYKKQVLDRDDMVDITDFDIVAWLKMEMRLMLDEELARAALIGDGRDPASEDKISESAIRPIAKDHELFTTTLFVNIDDASSSMTEVSDVLIAGRKFLKGSGMPTLYTTETYITRWLTLRDTTGRRLYQNLADLASELRVSDIVPVESLEDEPTIVAIVVNPADYTFGATAGGQVSMFDDFDIDYNRQKYLIETRCCGALTKLKSALVVKKVAAGITVVTPLKPTFNAHTRVVTIPSVTGVQYKLATYDSVTSTYTVVPSTPVITAGVQSAYASGSTTHIIAEPTSASYVLSSTSEDGWTFVAST
jgi:hypothetical protein